LPDDCLLCAMDGWWDEWTDGWRDRWMKWCFTSRCPLLYIMFAKGICASSNDTLLWSSDSYLFLFSSYYFSNTFFIQTKVTFITPQILYLYILVPFNPMKPKLKSYYLLWSFWTFGVHTLLCFWWHLIVFDKGVN
jgi:hypothetical protein